MTRQQRLNGLRILIALALLITAACLPIDGWWRLALFLVPYFVIGWDVLWRAVRNILTGRIFDENFLMAIATVGAIALGDYPEAVAVMLFYQIGNLFESIAVGKSRRSIAALMDIKPDHACVLRDGEEKIVPPEQVQVGEIIVLRPGERVPLDGVVVEGHTTLNTADLTGESLPRACGVGDSIISGAVNLGALVRARVTSVYAESTVARILTLVEDSSRRKARAENFITRFARVYTPCVVGAAALLAVLPPLLGLGAWSDWIERALIFLVVSCPCALVISVPLSFFGGIGGASRRGILIKGSNYLEALARCSIVALDKTGTLTHGNFRVAAVHPEGMTDGALLGLAAHAESYSNHPIAQSILAAYEGDLDKSRLGEVSERAGLGVSAMLDGRPVHVGNGALMQEAGADWHDCQSTEGTVVHVSSGSGYAGHIVIADEVKPGAKAAMAELKALGVKRTVMLTGDIARVGQAVGQALGLDEVHTGLLPDQKLSIVEELLPQKPAGTTLVFVGDGVNDAPVLSRADVGIAMGALGSDAAIEAADVVLMDDNPLKIPEAIRISRRTMRIVRQNIVFALSVKGIVLLLSALGFASMWIAVLADVGVMALAVLNAMRALRNPAQKEITAKDA